MIKTKNKEEIKSKHIFITYILQITVHILGFIILFIGVNPIIAIIYFFIVLILEIYFLFGSCILCEDSYKREKKQKPHINFRYCVDRPFYWVVANVSRSNGGSGNLSHPYLIIVGFVVLAGILSSFIS